MTLVDLVVEDEGWHALPLAELAEQAAILALTARGVDPAGTEISLLASNDTRIAELNGRFRGKAVATNVLSWPAFDLAPGNAGEVPSPPPRGSADGPILLGDVAIALQTISREAQVADIPLKNHVLHLILHGCLHLLGYDHEDDVSAKVMEEIERHALMSAGIPDPYKDRRGGGATE